MANFIEVKKEDVTSLVNTDQIIEINQEGSEVWIVYAASTNHPNGTANRCFSFTTPEEAEKFIKELRQKINESKSSFWKNVATEAVEKYFNIRRYYK